VCVCVFGFSAVLEVELTRRLCVLCCSAELSASVSSLQTQVSSAQGKCAEVEQQLTAAHHTHSTLRADCQALTTQLNAEKALSDARLKQCQELKHTEQSKAPVE
jgi:hypothetical protein